MSEVTSNRWREVADLLEANGYHVFDAEFVPPTGHSLLPSRQLGTIFLEIAPKREETKC